MDEEISPRFSGGEKEAEFEPRPVDSKPVLPLQPDAASLTHLPDGPATVGFK